jgi:1,4-alpha-glucan branching enzyme
MWTHPGKALFMGGEFGQWNEWNCNESLQWHLTVSRLRHAKWMADLNRLTAVSRRCIRGLRPPRVQVDRLPLQDSILAFIRRAKDHDFVVVCCNFTPLPRHNYRSGVRPAGTAICNSDSTFYGGSDLGNGGGIMAEANESHGRPASIVFTLPPLATVVFKPQR